jgi:hypothetical protein
MDQLKDKVATEAVLKLLLLLRQVLRLLLLLRLVLRLLLLLRLLLRLVLKLLGLIIIRALGAAVGSHGGLARHMSLHDI